MRTRALPLALLTAGLLLTGCASGGGSGSASGGTTSSSASSTGGHNPTTSSSTSGVAKAGCPSVGRAIPSGSATKPTVDVDGDGRPDTEWIATGPDSTGAVPFGIRTASGAVFAGAISSASPAARSVMFADVTGHGEVVALASDNRQVLLYAVSDCQIIPEKNAQGQQYAFDLGFTGYGTGVGCVDADSDGTTDLVGLKYLPAPQGQGQGQIQRTIVVLNGPNARNGATDTVPAGNANQADQARAVSCGDQTLAASGVSSGP